MRHGVVLNRLDRDAAHRRSLLNGLATSVLRQGLKGEAWERAVITTTAKAKAVRGLVERLVTYAKRGDLAARRQAARFVKDPRVLRGLFADLGKRYAKRPGGYTRVLKIGEVRRGDSAEMSLITLVEEEISPRRPKRAEAAKAGAPGKKGAKKINITKSESKEVPAPGENPKPA